MKVGTIAYSTSRGLGHLAKSFIDHGLITDILVVKHPGVPMNDWYPDAPKTDLRSLDHGLMQDFVSDKEAMLFFETPFWWPIIPYCESIGVRTYLITMYECTPTTHSVPHKYICPSLLDMKYFPERSVFLPLPVEYPWKLRTRAEWFIHNGGYLGMRGREGTILLIEAMSMVKSPIRLTVRVQENVPAQWQKRLAVDKRCEYIAETVPYYDLYGSGDVVVQPQKFNGCSLPLQEARASGMLVMTTDRYPMNTWLPREPLIPVAGYTKQRIGGAYLEFDEATINPEDIAATIDKWYGADITEYSEWAPHWASLMSWEVLLPEYRRVLES